MTGRPIKDPSDGIWDDGEWISWEWINGQLYEQDLRAEFPNAPVEIIRIFEELVQSDGRLGNDWVEVKTISPEKAKDKVSVKRAGNFNKLLVVRINEQFEFESRMIDRKHLGKGVGKNARYSWDDNPNGNTGV